MAKCKHENSVALETTNLINKWEVDAVIEHGNLAQLQHIEEPSKVLLVTITTRFCPNCGRIYGEITAAA